MRKAFKKGCLILILAMGFVGACLTPQSARADGFAKTTTANLIKTFIRFGALNIHDDNVINDYALLNECKVYKYFIHDDFRWHDVQTAIRQAIRQDVAVYPTAYNYDASLLLDRYDFKNNIYRFVIENGRQAINTFHLSTLNEESCGDVHLTAMPQEFNFVLDRSIQFPGIPLGEDQARDLLHDMEKSGNTQRKVYVRFKLKIVYIQPLLQKDTSNQPGGKLIYRQSDGSLSGRLDSRLDSIEFYQDEARTKLIMKYTP